MAKATGRTTRSSRGKKKEKEQAPPQRVSIEKPQFQVVVFTIRGTAPLVGNKFSARAKAEMRLAQEEGAASKRRKARDPKDFDLLYREAIHFAREGWAGFPAAAIRNAMVSACRVAGGYTMTKAKLMFHIIADGVDPEDDTPLVKITKGKPKKGEHCVRNASGVADIRARPVWDEGWEARVSIKFLQSQFYQEDIANLLAYAGECVGIGAGRPDSQKSNGMGWGLFEVL